MTPHFFTASEIQTMAEVSGLSMPDVLARLREAGQDTLPGGGAEVLSERCASASSPKKGGPRAWLDVHREAHRQGFRSTATMMYGHVEEPDDIVDHLGRDPRAAGRARRLHRLRALVLQARQYPAREVDQDTTRVPAPICRMLAASRLLSRQLRPHPGLVVLGGKAGGSGGAALGRRRLRAARSSRRTCTPPRTTCNKTTVDEIVTLIRDAGFTPVQRTTEYEILREYSARADRRRWSADGGERGPFRAPAANQIGSTGGSAE